MRRGKLLLPSRRRSEKRLDADVAGVVAHWSAIWRASGCGVAGEVWAEAGCVCRTNKSAKVAVNARGWDMGGVFIKGGDLAIIGFR